MEQNKGHMGPEPRIGITLCLSKKDAFDFARDEVSRRLGIPATGSKPPRPGKGRIVCQRGERIEGFTVDYSGEPPYACLLHAEWSVTWPEVKAWDIGESLERAEAALSKKGSELSAICRDYDLTADLLVRIEGDRTSMPVVELRRDRMAFWSSLGVNIRIAFDPDP